MKDESKRSLFVFMRALPAKSCLKHNTRYAQFTLLLSTREFSVKKGLPQKSDVGLGHSQYRER
jgi:hypothetical protein